MIENILTGLIGENLAPVVCSFAFIAIGVIAIAYGIKTVVRWEHEYNDRKNGGRE